MIHLKTFTQGGLAALALLVASEAAQAQIFVRNSTDVPNQNSSTAKFTENVDFGDVDLDGDFDAAFSHGGDQGNIQDRLWYNRGYAQAGTVGTFVDVTGVAFPTIARDGRDVEFVDFDNDADLDLYISNTSTNSNQTNLWWVNDGGKQGGTLGFYSDDTAARWVGLGINGQSSIAASQLIGGGFIDWSCDCDFGDLDNDGDLDLVHSTYGGGFAGTVPTRLFLNDGDGKFSEFNPSGFQLSGSTLGNGNPGLWCEGNQQANTSNTNGSNCDITTNTLDIDLGDIDGDFDLDILHGDRDAPTRFFYNRLEENGGSTLGFRDMTNFVYGLVSGGNWAPGTGHYEQEMGDFDGDNDLDLYGLNWGASGFNLEDIVAENIGGRFDNDAVLAGSSTDDNEGDFGDWDGDGDLDLYVGNFSGNDRLYTNNGSGSFSLVSQGASGLSNHGIGNVSLDIDWCDVDEDGDYDVFSAQDDQDPILYWENTNGVADTTPPSVSPVEDLGNFTATITTSPDRAVRAHVYDNAPYYITWYNPTKLNIYRNGELVETRDAMSSGGQVFRAEIPSNLVGFIEYEFVSEDQYGNSSTSVKKSYTADPGALVVDNDYGTAFNGPDFPGELLVESGSLLTPSKNWHIRIDVNTGQPAWFYLLAISLAPSSPTPDPVLGIVNVDVPLVVLGILGDVGPSGVDYVVLPIASDVNVPAGYLQVYRPNMSFMDWSASKGLEVPLHL